MRQNGYLIFRVTWVILNNVDYTHNQNCSLNYRGYCIRTCLWIHLSVWVIAVKFVTLIKKVQLLGTGSDQALVSYCRVHCTRTLCSITRVLVLIAFSAVIAVISGRSSPIQTSFPCRFSGNSPIDLLLDVGFPRAWEVLPLLRWAGMGKHAARTALCQHSRKVPLSMTQRSKL